MKEKHQARQQAAWRRAWWVATLAAGVLMLPGCGKSGADKNLPAATASGGVVDLTSVQKAFEDAKPGFRAPLDEALGLVQSGGYADALPLIRKLATNPNLTEKQKQALDALVEKLQALPAQSGGR